MNTVGRLRRDHAILRAKLDVLEAALRMGPEVWYVLREVCFTLARQLRDHIKREEELVAACRQTMISPPAGKAGGGMNPKILAEIVVEHQDEPEQLRTITRLFLLQPDHSLERLRPALQETIRRLRLHMSKEESELFPVLERTLAETLGSAAREPGRALLFDETTTVNRVVRDFPGVQPVFERLFINVPVEGCSCLDEVAWRHGMEARELLALLEQAVDACECRRQEPVPQVETAGAGASR